MDMTFWLTVLIAALLATAAIFVQLALSLREASRWGWKRARRVGRRPTLTGALFRSREEQE